jgi:hypothetical protein
MIATLICGAIYEMNLNFTAKYAPLKPLRSLSLARLQEIPSLVAKYSGDGI